MKQYLSKIDPSTGLPMKNAKLTVEDVKWIRKQGADHGCTKSVALRLAHQYKVGLQTIQRIWRGETFMYVEDSRTEVEQAAVDRSLELLSGLKPAAKELIPAEPIRPEHQTSLGSVPSIEEIFEREFLKGEPE